MKFVRLILRLIAIVFNLAVALFLLGVGFIGWIEGQDVNFDLVPGVEPENMAVTLIGLGIFALLATALSLKRSKFVRPHADVSVELACLVTARLRLRATFLQVRWHGAPRTRNHPFPDLADRPLRKLAGHQAAVYCRQGLARISHRVAGSKPWPVRCRLRIAVSTFCRPMAGDDA